MFAETAVMADSAVRGMLILLLLLLPQLLTPHLALFFVVVHPCNTASLAASPRAILCLLVGMMILGHLYACELFVPLLLAVSLRQKFDAVLNDEKCWGDLRAFAPFPASHKLSKSCPRIVFAHLLMCGSVRQVLSRHLPISKFFVSMTLWIHFV